MSTRITITDIVKTFKTPGGGTTRALDAVSLEVEPGELFFLLGPSGCGKTTLLRSIAGFVDPNSGSIAFGRDGTSRDVTHLPANQRQTAMVFQSYALWPHMTVADNVAFGLKVRKVDPETRKQRVHEALCAVQMDQYAARKPTQLSGGQQQRIALARALVVRPDVLLLDEPLSNLDVKLRIELRSEIRRIVKDAGLTAVYVTHDQKEALSMADRIAVMREGKIEQLGPPIELYNHPKTVFVGGFLGETNELVGQADAASGTITVKALQISKQKADINAPGAYRCLVRPESIELTAEAHAGAAPATVTSMTFLGEHVQYTAATADGERLTITSSDTLMPFAVGDRVGLRVAPDRVVVLNEQASMPAVGVRAGVASGG